MAKVIGIGNESFQEIRENDCFYIDKTSFIKEWWENDDTVTLITRPRRFGKTLNLNMLECFFSNKYKDRGDLFDGLDIWKEGQYRELQGTYPVIFISFAKIKQNNYTDTIAGIKRIICDVIQKYYFLKDWQGLTDEEKNNLKSITYGMDDLTAQEAIASISNYLSRYYGKKVIILLDEQGLSDKKDVVKMWYDGFKFGEKNDIYNPWSIINYLDKKKIATYWADSSSNGLINSLVQKGSPYIKTMMETLINGKAINVRIDEQIVFSELDYSEDAVWSLMLASGYLKVISSEELNLIRESENEYELALTNREILFMFRKMILRWFTPAKHETNEFIKALMNGYVESMNEYMNDVALQTFSSFDSGKKESAKKAPENFYHGFVLGLMVDQTENYLIISNHESGYGRYDIMLEPIDKSNEKLPGIVIEFKVINPKKETTLEDTVEAALEQIEEKKYDAELIKRGVKKENIHHYGFAFKGKEVLIESGKLPQSV